MFENHLILEFKIFSSSESDSGSIEIFLNRIAIILKSIDFSFVEIKVVLGGRLAVDSLRNLLFKLPLQTHRFDLYFIIKINYHHHLISTSLLLSL